MGKMLKVFKGAICVFLLLLIANPAFCLFGHGKNKKVKRLDYLEFETKAEWERKAKGIPLEERKIPTPLDYGNILMTNVADPMFVLKKYNTLLGFKEVDLSAVKKQKVLNSMAIADGKMRNMAYVRYTYLPATNQIFSEIFTIPLKKKLKKVDSFIYANIASGSQKAIMTTYVDGLQQHLFRIFEIVDFSPDNKKLLVKEKIGENYDGMWRTNIRVYNFETQQSVEMTDFTDTLQKYWIDKEGLDLKGYRWGLDILGFLPKNSDEIIVLAYAYRKENKPPKFLGSWLINVNTSKSRLLSLTETSYDIASTGYCAEKELNPYIYEIPKQTRGFFPKTVIKKKYDKRKKELEKRQKAGEF